MAISQNYPSVTPSLNLDFAKSKFLDPRITFTRASVGTYVGADGLIKSASSGAARFTHNPFTGESLGLLIEESRTNIRTYSSSINASNNYRIYGTPSYNTSETKAPDGTNTATKITGAGSAAGFDTYDNDYGNNQGVTQTYSVFVKNVNATSVRLGFSGEYVFTFATETGSGTGGFEKYPNGWYRIWATVEKSNQFLYQNLYMNGAAATTDSIYVWGAQNENASSPSSYIPTEASSVTRAAESATMTGTNFSSWYNTPIGGGTIFASYRCPPSFIGGSNPGNIWSFDGGGVRWLANWGPFQVYDGSAVVAVSPTNTLTSPVQEACAVERNGSLTSESVARNGIIYSTTGNVTTVGMNQLSIGFTSNTSTYLNGTISHIVYWKSKLTDSQLQSLTR